MMRIFDRIRALSTDDGFLHFQHDLSRRMYDALGQGYVGDENEVALIKRTVDAVNGQSYRGVRVFATIIHGPRSYVEFNFMDKPVTKELGDMTIVTLVTDGSSRLVQKTCVIQNKKERDGHWSIDEEQLYLLKSGPCGHRVCTRCRRARIGRRGATDTLVARISMAASRDAQNA